MSESYKTAISRTSISAPARLLKDKNLLKGRILDYGCGRGKDCEVLGVEGYDPYWQPNRPVGRFDTILCSFVLNTVEEHTQQEILNDIKSLLELNGKAYITVRRDIKNEGVTCKGTLQRNVILDLPVLFSKNNKFEIYVDSIDI